VVWTCISVPPVKSTDQRGPPWATSHATVASMTASENM
jgi:hypothetical protein